jgi:hypothetical protein
LGNFVHESFPNDRSTCNNSKCLKKKKGECVKNINIAATVLKNMLRVEE